MSLVEPAETPYFSVAHEVEFVLLNF